MLADHAARVLAGRTGFGAEARRPRGDAHRQLRLVDDVLAHEIGQRHFGCRDEPLVDLETPQHPDDFAGCIPQIDLPRSSAFPLHRLEGFLILICPRVTWIASLSYPARSHLKLRAVNITDPPKRRVLILPKLGKLRSSEHRVILHNQWRIDLGVAVLARVQVEHELGESAFKTRQRSLQHHEARA